MLTVHRPLAHENQADTWIGPAPWIVTSPPGPMTQWAISRYSRVNLPAEDRPYHLVVRRAQGTIVEDVDGNRFLDFNTGAGVCVVGHCHSQVVQAIEAQAHSLVHIGGAYCSHEPAIELAEKLEKISPGRLDKRILLTNSGTEAVEAAVRVIQNHTQRN
ncbi:MAG: aminotransferase class III-fold pyridoxal phosphate-dependent enzyme, partial [Planctomycetota bacterium]